MHYIFPVLSPHPADPTVTTDKLMEVVKEVEYRWEELGARLDMDQLTKLASIKGLYQSDHLRMKAVVDYYLKYHPTPSWRNVALALQDMGLHKEADSITTNYVRGMDVIKSRDMFDLVVDGQQPNFIIIGSNVTHFRASFVGRNLS